MDRPGRFLATLVTLCYCWLCMALPFEHTHHVTEDVEAFINLPGVHVHSQVSLPKTTRIGRTQAAPTPNCLACEWQLTLVSPAIPAFSFALTPGVAPRIAVVFPRALRVPAFAPSSRGPPVA
jgi:hypothetical protein